MRIRMLKTEYGSVDGIRVAKYHEGQEIDLTGTSGERELAAAFVGARLAEEIGTDIVQTSPQLAAAEPEEPPREVGDTQEPAVPVVARPAIAKPGRKAKAQ